MNEKLKSGTKQQVSSYTDLNYISPHSLGSIVDELERISDKRVHVELIPADANTYLFQMRYVDKRYVAATASGRLRRWADNMTHVYCEGKARPRIVKAPQIDYFFWGLIVLGFMFVALMLWIFAPQLLVVLGGGILLPLIPFVFYKMLSYGRIEQPVSQPEHKDRDYLLDIMVDIIADDDTPPRLAQAAQNQALTDAELTLLVDAIPAAERR